MSRQSAVLRSRVPVPGNTGFLLHREITERLDAALTDRRSPATITEPAALAAQRRLDFLSGVSAGGHHIGTTRISDDPRRGVADRNCRVHGIGNLWLAGSPLFPTCGSFNSPLNLLALAHGPVDHLKGKPA